jgi:2'-5' RNA ligase
LTENRKKKESYITLNMGFIYGIMPPIPPLKPLEGVQPVKPHITLVKLRRRVHVEVKYRQFVVTLGPVVLLPSPSRPRYIALRAEPQGELAALRTLLIAAAGDAVEERHAEFRPHLSLYAVRLKHPTRDDLAPAVEEAGRYVGVAFEVKAIYLIDTTEGLYMPVYTVPLHA